ncbi:hypothetical protein AVEN_101074-1, partial [Araneus ventricosus]
EIDFSDEDDPLGLMKHKKARFSGEIELIDDLRPGKRRTPFGPEELIVLLGDIPPPEANPLVLGRNIAESSGSRKPTLPDISPGDKRKRKRSGSSSRPKPVPKKRKSSAAGKKVPTKKASAGKKKGKKKK